MSNKQMHDVGRTSKRRLNFGTLIAIGIVLVGCRSTVAPQWLDRIDIEYLGASESDVIVKVVNRSDRTVHIQAEYDPGPEVVTWPSVTDIKCESIPPRPPEENPMALVDGVWRRAPIRAGEQVHLRVRTTIPQQYRGGRCRLILKLDEKVNVGPLEFTP